MEWVDFLANEAATNSLSPEQTEAFVERLKTKNSGKSEAKLASELNIGAAAFKKRMAEVYEKFAKSYPELATSNSRGKLEKLRACLTNKYSGGQDAIGVKLKQMPKCQATLRRCVGVADEQL
ncbi:hypothetical protein [Nostoc sp.]|uniref:hypothetical protein n=1 Tax=Nostoc sp. TaxID=1180 RepID=UPI002FF699AD